MIYTELETTERNVAATARPVAKHVAEPVRRFPAFVKALMVATLLVLVNFYPEQAAYVIPASATEPAVTVFGPGLGAYLWILNLWWSAALVLNLMLLTARSWSPLLHWMQIGSNLLATAALLHIAIGCPVCGRPLPWAVAPTDPDVWYAYFMPGLDLSLPLGLLLAAGFFLALACYQWCQLSRR